MTHYYQTGAWNTCCGVCGELVSCDIFVAEYPEQETGYIDALAICADCRRKREARAAETFECDRYAAR